MKLRGFVSTVLLLSLCWVAALNAYAQTAGSAVGAPADVTDAKAQFELAQKYDRGVGQPRDPGQASAWARKAADQGYAPAQFMLGMMYKRGDGVAQDVPEALRLLRLAAEQGDRFGQYQWGLENWTGANMPRNDRQAARWFELAGQQGIAEGMINLGLQFWNGKGVVRNAGVAWALSNLAQAEGMPDSAVATAQKNAAQFVARMSDAEKALGETTLARMRAVGLRPALTEMGLSALQDSSLPPLRVALMYVGPVGSGGWSFAHDLGRKALEAEFGRKIQVSYVESVPESEQANGVIRKLVDQGNTLIFGTTFGYLKPIQQEAAAYPGVMFEHATGYQTGPNVHVYDMRLYEGAYLAGVMAAKMTRSHVLGVVAAVAIPETIRVINAYTLGARSVDPKVKVKLEWVNEWYNPPKEAQAAQTLIRAGADVLLQNTDSPAVMSVAQRLGKRAFGWDSDMASYGPKAHLGSVVADWGIYYKLVTRRALDGTWAQAPRNAWLGVHEAAVDVVNIAPDVPAPVLALVQRTREAIQNDTLQIWRGPINDNRGDLAVAQGVVLDDANLQQMNYLVEGVEGVIPLPGKFN